MSRISFRQYVVRTIMTDSEWRPWVEDTESIQPSIEPEDLREDRRFPHPLTESRFQQVVQELPTGARLALHTCLSSWRVSYQMVCTIDIVLRCDLQNGQFTTAEFISFLICYKGNSKTLCEIFDNQTAPNTSDWNGTGPNRPVSASEQVVFLD